MKSTMIRTSAQSTWRTIQLASCALVVAGQGCSSDAGTVVQAPPSEPTVEGLPAQAIDTSNQSAPTLTNSATTVTSSARLDAKRPALDVRRSKWTAVDPALRARFVHTRQAEAGDEYRVDTSAGTAVARNPANALNIRYERDRVVMTHDGAAATSNGGPAPAPLTLAFHGIGRGSNRAQASVEGVQSAGTRIEYQRQGVVESYTNGPLGVEQTFTVARAPTGTGRVELGVAVEGGLTPKLVHDGVAVALVDASQRSIYEVGELVVLDANDQVLASSFRVKDGEIVLSYDDTNAVYPVQVDPLFATSVTATAASDGMLLDAFGYAAAIDGATAVVGAPGPMANAGFGEAYVFTRSAAGTWSEQQKLRWNDGWTGSPPANTPTEYGYAVAISGNTIAVGAPTGMVNNDGEVHIYEKTGSTFVFKKTLSGNDHVADSDDWFGFSIALSGDTIAIGAPQGDIGSATPPSHGSTYVAVRTGGVWSTPVPLAYTANPGDFGFSLALMGGTLLVGSPKTNSANTPPDPGYGIGRVWVYERGPSGFGQQTTFTSPRPTVLGNFGASVALADVTSPTVGTALIGQPGAFVNKGSQSGAAVVLTRSGTAWSPKATLVPAGAAAYTQYGDSVVLSTVTIADTTRTIAAVGAPASDSPVAIFVGSGATWSELPPIPGMAMAAVGRGLAISGNTLVVGTPQFLFTGTMNPFLSGSVNFMKVAGTNGDICGSASDCASGFCVDGVCCNSACGGTTTTDCQACSVAKGASTNGMCKTVASTITCRAAPNPCDAEEKCNGTSVTCPADKFKPAGTSCRAAAGPCDLADTCDGTSSMCADSKILGFCSGTLLACCDGMSNACGC